MRFLLYGNPGLFLLKMLSEKTAYEIIWKNQKRGFDEEFLAAGNFRGGEKS